MVFDSPIQYFPEKVNIWNIYIVFCPKVTDFYKFLNTDIVVLLGTDRMRERRKKFLRKKIYYTKIAHLTNLINVVQLYT